MEIILLEKIGKLGNFGDIVNVKNGYGRNFLIPNNKAIRATDANKAAFASRKIEIEKEVAAKTSAALEVKAKIEGKNIVMIRQASEDGKLYGSVTSGDLVKELANLFQVSAAKTSITLDNQAKFLGAYTLNVNLYADVSAKLNLIVARTLEEAENTKNTLLAEKAKSSKKSTSASAENDSAPAETQENLAE